jgi:hypothetical protein
MNLCVRSAVRIVGTMMVLLLVAWAPTAFAQADDVAASPDAKMILPVAGTWIGPINAGPDGSGTLTLTIMQNGKKLDGSFSSDINGGVGGSLKGNVAGDVVKVDLTDTMGSHHCKVSSMATVSGSDMSGMFMVRGGKHCHGSGTINLTKQ